MAAARETDDIARSLVRHRHDHPPPRDLNREADRRLTRGQRAADDLVRLIGSWTFVIAQVVLTLVWLTLNAIGYTKHWDPYPFQLLNLVYSVQATIWICFALMVLNRFAERERLRAQADYEINIKDEDELKALMTHLEVQDEVMLQVLNRLDRLDREMRRQSRRLGVAEEHVG
jgi:uncharacterized membrane protein